MFSSYSGAIVSIQETEISVPEDNGGQICIVLATGLERDISVTLTTTAGTASKCIVIIPREIFYSRSVTSMVLKLRWVKVMNHWPFPFMC